MNEAEFKEIIENIKQNKIRCIPKELAEKLGIFYNSNIKVLTEEQIKIFIDALENNQSICMDPCYLIPAVEVVLQKVCQRNFAALIGNIRDGSVKTLFIHEDFKYMAISQREKIIQALNNNISIVEGTFDFPEHYLCATEDAIRQQMSMCERDVNAAWEQCVKRNIARNKAEPLLQQVARASSELTELTPENVNNLLDNFALTRKSSDPRALDSFGSYIKQARYLKKINFPTFVNDLRHVNLFPLTEKLLRDGNYLRKLNDVLIAHNGLLEIQIDGVPIYGDICDKNYIAWLNNEEGQAFIKTLCSSMPKFSSPLIRMVLDYLYTLNYPIARLEGQVSIAVQTVYRETSNVLRIKHFTENSNPGTDQNCSASETVVSHPLAFSRKKTTRKLIALSETVSSSAKPLSSAVCLDNLSVSSSSNTENGNRASVPDWNYCTAKSFVTDFLSAPNNRAPSASCAVVKPKNMTAGTDVTQLGRRKPHFSSTSTIGNPNAPGHALNSNGAGIDMPKLLKRSDGYLGWMAQQDKSPANSKTLGTLKGQKSTDLQHKK